MMYNIVLLSLAVCSLSGAQGAIVKRSVCAQPTKLTDAQITQALQAHNNARATAGNNDASNMVALEWDDDLARRSQDWAELCKWGHDLMTSCDGDTVGQNLAMSGGGPSDLSAVDVSSYVEDWDSEKQFYDISDQSCKNATGHSQVCGHYTQVVWAETTKVGCGIAKCSSVTNGFNNAVVFACDYSPAGNFIGKMPYTVGTPCSNCPDALPVGGWMCNNQMCESCTPASQGASCNCDTLTCQNGGTWNAGECKCNCPSTHYGKTCESSCECNDTSPYCNQWEALCPDSLYRKFMTDNCEGTCKDDVCVRPASCPV